MEREWAEEGSFGAALRCAWARGRGGCVEVFFGERLSKVEVRERRGEERTLLQRLVWHCQSEIDRIPCCVLVHQE